jgi:CRP-like cAMP-binding protein
MFEKLHSFFQRKGLHLTDKQFEFVKTVFNPTRVNKGEFLLRAGEQAKYGIFVASGCLRTYTIDDKGKEHFFNSRLRIGGQET